MDGSLGIGDCEGVSVMGWEEGFRDGTSEGEEVDAIGEFVGWFGALDGCGVIGLVVGSLGIGVCVGI